MNLNYYLNVFGRFVLLQICLTIEHGITQNSPTQNFFIYPHSDQSPGPVVNIFVRFRGHRHIDKRHLD